MMALPTDTLKYPLPADQPLVYPGVGRSQPPQPAPQQAPPAYCDAPPPYSQTTETHIYQTTANTQQQQQPISNTPVVVQRPAPVTYGTIGSQRVVETVPLSRRTTMSVVSDLETGQTYTVKERTSLTGRRSKTVIRELGGGGAKTVVKTTPRRTVVKQKF
ncbi:uncharacterized protein LOC101864129 [Aplysia californica]|uniref:Uncharacterized protein LOC101864129 n=1 Tax=Aplysia californica TaxID=6500 RepID=A0ABM0JHD2_APLCA|nr:uncharacterized protein LOC101864129 [Aplysia californica]